MCHALQRRLARLFPHGNETFWLDCRNNVPRRHTFFSVAVIGLDFIAASGGHTHLPARSLVLDMDNGADMEDLIRSGADGLLCSPLLPWDRLAALARQCRRWNYPFIADCRETMPETIQRFCFLGTHAVLLGAQQSPLAFFNYYITRLVPGDLATFSLENFTGVRHEH